MVGVRRRMTVAVVIAAALVTGATACDRPSTLPRAKAGARCPKDGAFARNATHVLQCKRNLRWTAILPIGQADSLYVNFVLNPPTTAAPATTSPPAPPATDSPITVPPAPLVTVPPITVPPVTVPPLPAETQPEVVTAGPPAPADGRVAVDGISADGRYALVTISGPPGDDNAVLHLIDRTSSTTTRIAPAGRGVLSANGEYAAFGTDAQLVAADTDDVGDVYRWRRSTGAFTRVTVGLGGAVPDRGAGHPAGVSDDGRFVLFPSGSSNLVPGDTNDTLDLFVRDLTAGTTTRVNVTSAGEQSEGTFYPLPARLSASGRYVAFATTATNLRPDDTDGDFDVFRRDMTTGAVVPVTLQHADEPGMGGGLVAISADGDRVLIKEGFAGRVVTMSTGSRVDPAGAPPEYVGQPSYGEAAYSPNARYVGYTGLYQTSFAGYGPALVVTDQETHETRLVRAGYPCDAGPGRLAVDGPTMHITDNGRVFCAGGAAYSDPNASNSTYRTYLWPSPFG